MTAKLYFCVPSPLKKLVMALQSLKMSCFYFTFCSWSYKTTNKVSGWRNFSPATAKYVSGKRALSLVLLYLLYKVWRVFATWTTLFSVSTINFPRVWPVHFKVIWLFLKTFVSPPGEDHLPFRFLNLNGKWSSPGGETKVFRNSQITLKWTGQTRGKFIVETDNKVVQVAKTLQTLSNTLQTLQTFGKEVYPS